MKKTSFIFTGTLMLVLAACGNTIDFSISSNSDGIISNETSEINSSGANSSGINSTNGNSTGIDSTEINSTGVNSTGTSTITSTGGSDVISADSSVNNNSTTPAKLEPTIKFYDLKSSLNQISFDIRIDDKDNFIKDSKINLLENEVIVDTLYGGTDFNYSGDSRNVKFKFLKLNTEYEIEVILDYFDLDDVLVNNFKAASVAVSTKDLNSELSLITSNIVNANGNYSFDYAIETSTYQIDNLKINLTDDLNNVYYQFDKEDGVTFPNGHCEFALLPTSTDFTIEYLVDIRYEAESYIDVKVKNETFTTGNDYQYLPTANITDIQLNKDEANFKVTMVDQFDFLDEFYVEVSDINNNKIVFDEEDGLDMETDLAVSYLLPESSYSIKVFGSYTTRFNIVEEDIVLQETTFTTGSYDYAPVAEVKNFVTNNALVTFDLDFKDECELLNNDYEFALFETNNAEDPLKTFDINPGVNNISIALLKPETEFYLSLTYNYKTWTGIESGFMSYPFTTGTYQYEPEATVDNLVADEGQVSYDITLLDPNAMLDRSYAQLYYIDDSQQEVLFKETNLTLEQVNNLNFVGITPETQYIIRVYGDYTIFNDVSYTDQLIGEENFTTSAYEYQLTPTITFDANGLDAVVPNPVSISAYSTTNIGRALKFGYNTWWNTQPDGQGDNYLFAPSSLETEITVGHKNITLYAMAERDWNIYTPSTYLSTAIEANDQGEVTNIKISVTNYDKDASIVLVEADGDEPEVRVTLGAELLLPRSLEVVHNEETITAPLTLGTCGGNFTSVVIPREITGISSNLFAGVTALMKVDLETGSAITILSSYAFSGCTNLVSVKLPESLKTIAAYAFLSCGQLTDLVLPDTLESIYTNAFQNCIALGTEQPFVIPVLVTTIAVNAFSGWTGAQTIYIAENADTSGWAWDYASSDINVVQLPLTPDPDPDPEPTEPEPEPEPDDL